MGLVRLENDASPKIAKYLHVQTVEKSPRFKQISICKLSCSASLNEKAVLVNGLFLSAKMLAFLVPEWYF